VLYRGPDDPEFTAADERQLADLLPLVARGLEWAPPGPGDARHVPRPEQPETLLLTLDGCTLQASAGAHRLLLLADDGLHQRSLSEPIDTVVARLLSGLLVPLRLHQGASPGVDPRPAPTLTRLNAYGRFDASAALLRPPTGTAGLAAGPAEPLVQVTLSWLEPMPVALSRALRALPITAGQAAVCRELYEGQAQPEIALRLGVAPSTVADHVRKVYRLLDVTSAWDLRLLLDRRIGAVAT
jgi:DNA-binding CsgD family transcriptional regulator